MANHFNASYLPEISFSTDFPHLDSAHSGEPSMLDMSYDDRDSDSAVHVHHLSLFLTVWSLGLFTQHLLNPGPGSRSKILLDRELILRQISHQPPKAGHEREYFWHVFNGTHHLHNDV